MLAIDGIGDFFAETNHEGPRNMSSKGVLVLETAWWMLVVEPYPSEKLSVDVSWDYDIHNMCYIYTYIPSGYD